MNNILEIKDLRKIYHSQSGEIEAIRSFSFFLKDGEFVGIVGPSGCGKSTILSILCGLDCKTSGNINYLNSNIGYMLQNDSLFEWRNVIDNCLLGSEIRNELNNESKDYVMNLINSYGLSDFKYKYPDSLSGGMRQRVG